VVLPGLAGTRTEFAALASRFQSTVRCHVLDPFRTGDLTVDGQADRLAATVRHLSSDPAVVVGHSHGGLVALSVAAQHPDLVAGVVLVDTPVLLPPAARLLVRVPLAALSTPLARPAIRRFFAATFRSADPPAWRAEVLARLEAVPLPTIRAVVAGTFTYDSARRLQALSVPALCIRANIPIRLEKLPAGIQTADIPDAGHWVHVHAVDRTSDAIANFLSTLPTQPSAARPTDARHLTT
jgi:pimeloyl-ACP methyl ester carboxylesterase